MTILKQKRLEKLYGKERIFRALAIDQRGALKRMLGEEVTDEQLQIFKRLVSENLTTRASAILLDPEFGWQAAGLKEQHCGLIMAYEKTGYDKTKIGRFPDLIDGVSVKGLKEKGADAVKLLLYFDVDEGDAINRVKTAFVERVGSECIAEEMPFFLEILTYDSNVSYKKEFAKMKPEKVIEAMKVFSNKRFAVDVLKVEVPVDMNYVQGFTNGEDYVYTQKSAQAFFKEQSDCSDIPFIFLSAGVSPKLFQDTLEFAKSAGSTFNGVLCGRATWAGSAEAFKTQGVAQAAEWLRTQGVKNINELNEVLMKSATPVK
ncbi:Tagatose 1,6-diphosphate aldolase [Aggregatibacter actinomycetemcomitans]|uniref:tagatose 1,6-diphosphate aldolase n=1 Tax=Aggregatibacter actinomycetemcomitans TaxID=714 RepID=UPI00022BFFCC|nr:tagatose 1,6-diphosphate aldolase [Aggregatibacter actinomycetemcomitans]KOE62527.1 tagatose-bisphosphate aldolase [Aggregatibacter actinomycetemcomitans serotype c str. D17P-2]KYK75084.1 tagatose-bisphosphate aldolase [Aggregatibacter actinomycetemcomitans serotype e str. SA2149]KYK79813.1 tagatose-bisphosphate aldolase [Aggregatibacter actinomycetemcomitans SC383s]MCE3056969.1 tagatose 1,6-diphosphate aldolase [Aggregatibacter actinomycetemcomitans]TYA13924.1 tagatose 1,6-diphosphate aldo